MHALFTGPEVAEQLGGAAGVQPGDGLSAWQPRPGQVGASGGAGGGPAVPGSGESLPAGTPDEEAAARAGGSPMQPGVAQGGPPSRGRDRAAAGALPVADTASNGAINDDGSPAPVTEPNGPADGRSGEPGSQRDWLDRNFGGGRFGEPGLLGNLVALGSFGGGFVPVLGEAQDVAQLVTGRDANGNAFTGTDYAATIIGLALPFVPAGAVRGLFRGARKAVGHADEAADLARAGLKNLDVSPKMIPGGGSPTTFAQPYHGQGFAAPNNAIEYPLTRPPGVSDADWQKKLDALNKAAAEGKAKVVHNPVRDGKAQKEARRNGTVEPGHDADHSLDLQYGGTDTNDNIQSTQSRVNRSVGGQGKGRMKYPDVTPIKKFVDKEDEQ